MPLLSSTRRRLIPGLLIVILMAVGGVAVWFTSRPSLEQSPPPDEGARPDPPPPDPRLIFDTPFRNVKPDLHYVGDAVCARCHQTIAKSYHAHPMGRSAATISKSSSIEKFDPSGHTRFSSGPFDLEVDTTNENVFHRIRLREGAPVSVPELALPVAVAIGSGTRGRSYLTVEGGAVWQTPLSWYGPDQKWDVSPGFRLGDTVRRAIAPACLYCHVDRVEPVAGAENRYREPLFAAQASIGCERCHGPGELHVAERTRGGLVPALDTTIVNPRHLSAALQLAICEQCHLQGDERVNRRGRDLFEFRPGLPFEQFVSVHVRHADIAAANKSVGQFEQMEQSRCFTASNGRLLCTSCHDPHAAPGPAERDGHYRKRCLTCHESKGCSLPATERQAKNDSCIACHMPKAASATIIHASVTDHRVPRRPINAPAIRGLPAGAAPIVRFRNGAHSPPSEERERDLAIALARFGKKPLPRQLGLRDDFRMLAVGRLQSSLKRWPGDVEGWTALSSVLVDRDDTAEKLRAAMKAVSLAPESDHALVELAEAATAAGKFDLAEETASKSIRLNPTAAHPLIVRAFVHLSNEAWEKAEADARAALAIHPLHPEGHLYLGICLNRRGNPAAGLREAQTAVRLEADPRQQAYLMDLYRRATR